jgi:folate-dependent phosphoribosylglycinamide formyltransferase PurN
MFHALDGLPMETRPWIAFFSQTGSEIVQISRALGRWPDMIITNRRPDSARTIDSGILKDRLYFTSNKPEEYEYHHYLRQVENPIITLHGWLRVVPEDVCEKHEMYNGHPGLITRYPELKGKDPQMRAFQGNYDTAGCVIHKVTPGVDEGEILMEREVGVRLLDLDGLFHILHKTSVNMWIEFLKERL